MVRNLLAQLMEEVEHSVGPIRPRDLAERLGVDQAALDGMLRTLEQKGLVVARKTGGEAVVCASGCRTACGGLASCPFIADVPEPIVLRPLPDR
jgi:predicted transcriptional regulator